MTAATRIAETISCLILFPLIFSMSPCSILERPGIPQTALLLGMLSGFFMTWPLAG